MTLRKLWRRFLAWTRLSQTAVCEESRGMSWADYHDYSDTELGEPWHMTVLKCRHCGKEFTI